MPRGKTPSFVTEFPLVANSKQNRELLARFQAGRQLYNACLDEAMIRMKLLRQSNAYQEAKTLPKTIGNIKGEVVQNPARKKAFAAARKAYRYSDFDQRNGIQAPSFRTAFC